MLQSIRDYTHGWIATIIVSLLILSFALWGIHSYLLGAGSNDTVAKVNGTEINKHQVGIAYERLRRQLLSQNGAGYQLSTREESGLKQRALQTLIDIQVLQQASLDQDFRISPEQIEGFLQSIPDFQVNGEFSLSRFQQLMAANMFNVGEFLDTLKTSLLIDQPRFGIMFTSFALPNEIESSMALVEQQRNIAYLIIPQNHFANQPVTIPEDAITAYYNQHQNEFKTPEQVSLEYVLLSTKELAAKTHPTEAELKKFYTENTSEFAAPAQWQLEEIILPLKSNASDDAFKQAAAKMGELVKTIESGTSSADIAKKYGTTSGDAKLKNWATLAQMTQEQQKAVATLNKVGMVSEPFRTNAGLAVLKVTAFKEGAAQPFESVKEKVKTTYLKQRAEEQFGDVREKLASLTYEHPESLATAASQLNLPVQTTVLFTKEQGGKDLSENPKIREAAFSNDVMMLQNNSDVIQLDPETVVVVRVKTHVPAALLSLDAVRKQITDRLKANAIEDKTKQLANEITNNLATGKTTLTAAQSQYHLSVTDAGFIGRHVNKIDQAILDTAFEMAKPQDNKQTFAFTKTANGYAVIALNAVKDGNAAGSKEQYQAYAEQIQGTQGNLEYQLYRESLLQHAKIVIE